MIDSILMVRKNLEKKDVVFLDGSKRVLYGYSCTFEEFPEGGFANITVRH